MKEVIIYTGKNCTHCHHAKDFFDAHDITYTEHNTTDDKEAKKFLIKKRVMSVPFIMIDGKEFIGFDEEVISDALNI